jgi:hypothetical protein
MIAGTRRRSGESRAIYNLWIILASRPRRVVGCYCAGLGEFAPSNKSLRALHSPQLRLVAFVGPQVWVERFHAIYCLRSEERGPIMDTVLSFLISAGIIAFGVWVVAETITAGWPWTLMGLLAVIVGLLSLYGSVRDARTP